MKQQPTCEDCIVYLKRRYIGDPTNLQELLCERLRETGACLVQNSQRIVVVVAPQAATQDVRALMQGGAIWERPEAERR